MTTKEKNRPLRVLQLTDPHLMARADGDLLGVRTRESLQAVIAEVLKVHGQPDLILATGDLAQDGSVEAYRVFGESLKSFSCPSVWIAGNHDHIDNLLQVSREYNASDRHVIQGGWQFVMLDSSVPGKVFGALAESELAFLSETPPGPIVDGTCGGGGHTFALRERTDSARRIIGIDRDPDAIAETQRRIGGDERITLVCGNFSDLGGAVKKAGVNSSNEVAGIVLDLGVSSWQLDQPTRGFTFQDAGPLDMRMDQGSDGPTARCIIRDTPIAELARILAEYGDVKRPFRVAQALKDAEADGELGTTSDLAGIVAKVRGTHTRGRKIHPATTVFQALRIAVNDELGQLRALVAHAAERDPAVREADPVIRLRKQGWMLACRLSVVPDASIPEVTARVKSALAETLEGHTGLPVVRTDLDVQVFSLDARTRVH